jgi:hypothetical protein
MVPLPKYRNFLVRDFERGWRPCPGRGRTAANYAARQKTAFEFARDRFRDDVKDDEGNSTGGFVYSIQPRSFLVVGNLYELKGNDDKVTCFELNRRNIRSPEILTFDELFYRASYIVENISREIERER